MDEQIPNHSPQRPQQLLLFSGDDAESRTTRKSRCGLWLDRRSSRNRVGKIRESQKSRRQDRDGQLGSKAALSRPDHCSASV